MLLFSGFSATLCIAPELPLYLSKRLPGTGRCAERLRQIAVWPYWWNRAERYL